MKIKLFGNIYDATIDSGNVILESLHEAWIIEGLGDKIEIDADYEYWHEGGLYRMGWTSFYSEFIEKHLQSYVESNREHVQKVIDFSKNVN